MNLVFDQNDLVGRWVCERTGGQYVAGESASIGMEHEGRLIAGVLYDRYNGRSIAMHVAGEGGRWITRGFLRAAFHYPFRQLRVHKILGIVDSSNAAAIRLDKHLGFRLEARVRDAAPFGDLLIFGMTADQCRYLQGEHSGKQSEHACTA